MIQYQLAIDLEPPRLGVIESYCFWLQNVRSDCFLMVQRECFSAIKKMFSKIYVTFLKCKGPHLFPHLALTIGAPLLNGNPSNSIQPIRLDSGFGNYILNDRARFWFYMDETVGRSQARTPSVVLTNQKRYRCYTVSYINASQNRAADKHGFHGLAKLKPLPLRQCLHLWLSTARLTQ